MLQITRPRDQQYLYMPNPTLINIQSSKTQHFLGLVDVYIRLGRPEIYEVEPVVNENYRPDAYTRINGEPVVIELQRSTVSAKKMQAKVDAFVESHIRRQHDAKTLWIISPVSYKLNVPTGYRVVQQKEKAVAV